MKFAGPLALCMHQRREAKLCGSWLDVYTTGRESRTKREGNKKVFRRITDHNVPMGRVGDSFDITNAVTFPCSDAARHIAAHAQTVNGGIMQLTRTGAWIYAYL